MVAEFVLVPGVLRDHGVRRFEPQDTVFAGLVVEQRFVVCRNHVYTSYAAFVAAYFTLNRLLSDIETYSA